MRTLGLVVVLALSVTSAVPGATGPEFRKVRLTDAFYGEGASVGDFNRDGHPDVVSGPYWYEGPAFEARHQVHEPKAYDPVKYSENFLTYTGDFSGDGWPDIFYVPFPGKEGRWYENPADKEGPWVRHLALRSVDNESPMWADVDGDGRPDLLCCTGGYFGYATWDPARPGKPWTFHAVSPKGKYHRFSHGMGYGDVNGDGRVDLLESDGWWEHPAEADPGEPWTKHPFRFAEAGCQMYARDFTGDGLPDIVTAWHCHRYGLLLWQQTRAADGAIGWRRHVILPPEPDLGSDVLRISQLHAIDVADLSGDGVPDIVTGKRFWAHGPKGDPEPNAPALLVWFETKRGPGGGVSFVPHRIDEDSGVGTQVTAADLNQDGTPDVVVGNKKGTFLFLSGAAGRDRPR